MGGVGVGILGMSRFWVKLWVEMLGRSCYGCFLRAGKEGNWANTVPPLWYAFGIANLTSSLRSRSIRAHFKSAPSENEAVLSDRQSTSMIGDKA